MGVGGGKTMSEMKKRQVSVCLLNSTTETKGLNNCSYNSVGSSFTKIHPGIPEYKVSDKVWFNL